MTGDSHRSETSSSRPRALVIDDEEPVRVLLSEFLRVLGFETDGAPNGLEGLALFERGEYALVVTDLAMPGMTGWEVVEAVRRRAPTTGIMMVTGSASNLETARAAQLSLILLSKPVQFDEFQAAVQRARKRVSGGAASSVVDRPR